MFPAPASGADADLSEEGAVHGTRGENRLRASRARVGATGMGLTTLFLDFHSTCTHETYRICKYCYVRELRKVQMYNQIVRWREEI